MLVKIVKIILAKYSSAMLLCMIDCEKGYALYQIRIF